MNKVDSELFALISNTYSELGKPTSRSINKRKDLKTFKDLLLNTFTFIADTPQKIAHIVWCVNNNISGETACEFCGGYHSSYNKAGERRRCCCDMCVRAAVGISKKGTTQSEETKNTRKKTMLDRHGVDNPARISESKEKAKQTSRERYGTDHPTQADSVKYSMRTTIRKRLGVDNASQSVEIKQKKVDTCMRNHGVAYPMQSAEVKERSVESNRQNRGVDYPMQCVIVQGKSGDTHFEKLGVRNPMQSEIIKARINNSNMEEYGVMWSTQIPTVKQQIDDTFYARYGCRRHTQIRENRVLTSTNPDVDHTYVLDDASILASMLNEYVSVSELAEFLGVHTETVYKSMRLYNIPNPIKSPESTGQRQLRQYIESCISVDILVNDRDTLGGKELDIYIPSMKIAFEYNGNYYHSTRYNTDKLRHINKTNECELIGITLIQIFEDEWLYRNTQVKQKIASLLGVDKRDTVYARSCVVVDITPKQAYEFLETNHIQGKTKSSIRYGLEHDGELVAVMTFGKGSSPFAKYMELSRYATSKRVVGGFSKLMKHFWLMNRDVDKLVSFADKRYSTGNMYFQNGWTLVNTLAPNYTYLVNGKRVRKERFMRRHLANIFDNYDESLTEEQNCTNNGVYRIYDCGLLKCEITNPFI